MNGTTAWSFLGVNEGTVYCIMSVEETGVYKTTVALSITIFRLFKFN